MSKFITQNPSKSRRKEASRERKASVWKGMSRFNRRAFQTAGIREMHRERERVLNDRHGAITGRFSARNPATSNPPREAPHSSYLDAIGVPEDVTHVIDPLRTKRQEAARKAAATRAANKAAKGV